MFSIYLCAISNIKSGACDQDCSFCTQSIKHKANIAHFEKKSLQAILEQARQASALGASGFCLVSSGKSLTPKLLQQVCEAALAIKKQDLKLKLIACNGLATYEQLCELKKAGIEAYNHNLETSESYYPNICSTHSWQERYNTCLHVKKAGLDLVCGGIFGIGESLDDRKSLFSAIASLEPANVPINFFHHHPSLPLKPSSIDANEALEIIKQARQKVSKAKKIMVAGGRAQYFGVGDYQFFENGANAIVIGDYLTTKGHSAKNEISELKKQGYSITNCKA